MDVPETVGFFNTAIRRRKTDDRNRKSEDGSQKTENGSQILEGFPVCN